MQVLKPQAPLSATHHRYCHASKRTHVTARASCADLQRHVLLDMSQVGKQVLSTMGAATLAVGLTFMPVAPPAHAAQPQLADVVRKDFAFLDEVKVVTM